MKTKIDYMAGYQPTELAIRSILRKAVDRVHEDNLKSIEHDENSVTNHQKLCKEYEAVIKKNPGILQDHQIYEKLINTIAIEKDILKNWTEIRNTLIPFFNTASLAKIKKLIDYDLSVNIRMGIRLLQSDFHKKRENKPDIGEPGYIERILNDYDKYRLHAEEYRDISYWLNIAETDKWLEKIAVKQGNRSNPEEGSLDLDEYERRQVESFEKYRHHVFQAHGSRIKELINSPETTWPRGSEKWNAFIRKHNRKMKEHLINHLAWWFFVREGRNKHDMPCKGIGTPEAIEKFQLDFKQFFVCSVMKFFVTISLEETLKESEERPAVEAIQGLEEMLNTFKKRELRESHFGFHDDNADWRAYNIKLISQEIEFHQKRLAMKSAGVPDKSRSEIPENESTMRTETNREPHKDHSGEKQVYRIASEHKPGTRWPDCVFDELVEIQRQTKEINLKVCERFAERAGIIDQASALLKAWKDHNSGKRKKGTIQAQSRHGLGTI
jgi:hypothetical protein